MSNLPWRRILRSELSLGHTIAKQKHSTVLEATYEEKRVVVKQSVSGTRARHEAEMLSAARHPNVLGLHGVCETEESEVWLVLQLGDAGTLNSFIKHNEPKGPIVHSLLSQVARAMAHVHDCSLVHRDCKTENILMSQDCGPLLSDFGHSCYLPEGEMIRDEAGSILHMAPEVMRGDPYGRECDVYSFSMCSYELTQLMPPFLGKMSPGIPGSLLPSEFREEVGSNGMRPRFFRPDEETGGYQELIKSCWDQDPANRPNFEQVVAHLDEMEKERA
jgi:serine/threonine protein kinase